MPQGTRPQLDLPQGLEASAIPRAAPSLSMRLAAPLSPLGRHYALTRELVRRDVLGRYKGANFGLLWTLLGPLMMLVIYTVAFGEILGGRWQQPTGSEVPFGIVLFLGIVVHGFFAECFARSPRLMLENSNYIKRVVFPLHVLPWTVVLSACFHLVMNLAVFVVLSAVMLDGISPYIFLAPVVLVPMVLLTIAMALVVSSIGVYLRDVNLVVPMVVTAMLFLSSAIIPVEALDPKFQRVFHLNPLTFFIDQVRDVALWGRPPDWIGLLVRSVLGVVALYAAHAWFRLTSRGFADVL